MYMTARTHHFSFAESAVSGVYFDPRLLRASFSVLAMDYRDVGLVTRGVFVSVHVGAMH